MLVAPQLSRHVAERVRDETAVLKERRKAKEETRLVSKAPKGGSKGKGSDGAGGAAEK